MSLLSIQNLSVGYDRTLISLLNHQMVQGERLIVYGSNGTGKSTLLQTLISKNSQKRGQVTWNIPLTEVLHLQQQTQFHSQTPDDVKNYLMNVTLFNKPFHHPSENDWNKIKETQKKLKLPDMPLKNLSGGQRQKLKLSRALLLETKALLLDEPFNAIDQLSTHELIDWLNETLPQMMQIIVLHDFDQIEKLKSKILWIQENHWEILDFSEWFQKVDKRFHTWIHSVQKNSSDKKGAAEQ